jgi:hypothetical protein
MQGFAEVPVTKLVLCVRSYILCVSLTEVLVGMYDIGADVVAITHTPLPAIHEEPDSVSVAQATEQYQEAHILLSHLEPRPRP